MALQKTSRSNLVYFAALVSIAIISYIYFLKNEEAHKSIVSFESCVSAGYPVQPTYPEECKIPGKTFTNPNQVKEPVSPVQASSSTKTYFDLEYLVNGDKLTIGTGSQRFLPTQLGHVTDLNNDSLADVAFVVEKKVDIKTSEYYLLLALGLHNGEFAAANGLLIDELVTEARPTNVYINKNNEIEVAYTCIEGHECFYKFIVKNDILEQQR